MSEENKIKRKEVKEKLIKDLYFEKRNYWIKIYQTVIASLGWIGFILPFAWLALPYLFPIKMGNFKIYSYFEEIITIRFLFLFLSIVFFILVISYSLLTLLNNYRFKNMLQNKEQYNISRLNKRELILERAYTERFGSVKNRNSVKYYSVSEEQNLSVDFVKELFEKEDVS